MLLHCRWCKILKRKVKRKINISISRTIAVLVACFGIANLLTNNYVYNLLALVPVKVALDIQLWRVISFVFIPGTIEGSLLFAFTFWFIAPLLEERFNPVAYPVIIMLISLLQGITFSLFFWKSHLNFAGPDSLSMFILTLFTLSELWNRSRPKKLFGLPAMSFVTLASMLWLSSVLIHYSMTTEILLYNSIFSASFGIIIALSIYLQIRLTHSFKTYPEKTPRYVPKAEPEFLHQSSAQRETASPYHNADLYDTLEDKYDDEDWSDYYSESRLNNILDKMNEYGNDSLTEDERLYLKEYSRRMTK